MTRQDVRFRSELLGYRKTDVKNCMEHLYALNAMDQRLAKQTQQGLEDTMAQIVQENSALRQELARQNAAQVVASAAAEDAQSQLELLNRKLAAAQSEIRRYQTRLFACERALLALRRENAELEAACEKAREGTLLPPQPPQLPVLDAPDVPEFAVSAAAERISVPACTSRPGAAPDPAVPKEGGWEPTTELERLSVFLLDQMQRLMEE